MNLPTNFHALEYFPFLAIFGVLASFWQQTRDFLLKIFRIFWKQREIPYDFIYVFYKELKKESIVLDLDDYRIHKNNYYFSNKHNRWIPVLFRLTSFEILLYKNFIPIFVSGADNGKIRIQYLKFTFNFNKFFHNICELVYNDISLQMEKSEKRNRFFLEEKKGISLKRIKSDKSESNGENYKSNSPISSSNSNRPEFYILEPHYIVNNKIPKSIGIDINNISMSISIPSEQNKYQFTETGDYICSQVERWLNAKTWYESKNINWRRGILLNGKPGNGKSSLVLEVAKKVGIPLYIFDLSSMDNLEFDKLLGDLCSDSAIILFEDFDNVFHGRNNVTKTNQFGGLTFDYFINKLSGVNSVKNKFIFITSNHIEKIDPAVLRPGRIDEKIEVLPLNYNEKLKMANIILKDNDLINKAIQDSEQLTTAEFENKCIQIALGNFWSKK